MRRLPFNNQIVLCSISGSKLKSRFINNSSSDYHIALSEYGSSLSISNSKTYYVVVDMYTALYSYNGLTVVSRFDDVTYARDLLADHIRGGGLDASGESYTITPISEILSIGSGLGANQGTSEVYYTKGTVTSIVNATYGNLYIEDENGNSLYIYGISDESGNSYKNMSPKPKVGDTITVRSTIYKYGTSTIEFMNAVLIEIE